MNSISTRILRCASCLSLSYTSIYLRYDSMRDSKKLYLRWLWKKNRSNIKSQIRSRHRKIKDLGLWSMSLHNLLKHHREIHLFHHLDLLSIPILLAVYRGSHTRDLLGINGVIVLSTVLSPLGINKLTGHRNPVTIRK